MRLTVHVPRIGVEVIFGLLAGAIIIYMEVIDMKLPAWKSEYSWAVGGAVVGALVVYIWKK